MILESCLILKCMQDPIPLFQLLPKDYVLKYNVKPLHCKSLRHIQIIYYFEEYDVYNLIGVYEEYEEYDMA